MYKIPSSIPSTRKNTVWLKCADWMLLIKLLQDNSCLCIYFGGFRLHNSLCSLDLNIVCHKYYFYYISLLEDQDKPPQMPMHWLIPPQWWGSLTSKLAPISMNIAVDSLPSQCLLSNTEVNSLFISSYIVMTLFLNVGGCQCQRYNHKE